MNRASHVLVFAFGVAAVLIGCQQSSSRVVAAAPQSAPTTRAVAATDERATPFVDSSAMFTLEEDLYANVSAWVSGPLLAPEAPNEVRVLSFTLQLMQQKTLHETSDVYGYVDRHGADSFELNCESVRLSGPDGLKLSTPGAGLGKMSGAYIVRLQPRAGLTWGDVATHDDFTFSVEKDD